MSDLIRIREYFPNSEIPSGNRLFGPLSISDLAKVISCIRERTPITGLYWKWARMQQRDYFLLATTRQEEPVSLLGLGWHTITHAN